MTTRWIVDVDGRGACAVAAEESGRNTLVSEPQTREKCERLIARLRDRDATRALRVRQESGRRLAARRAS